MFSGGPFEVTAKANQGQNRITVNLEGHEAKATDRLVIANHNLEIDLAQDASGTGVQTLVLAENIPYTVNVSTVDDQGKTVPKPVYGILTKRVGFRVKDGELVHQDRAGKTVVLAREITSGKPFSRIKKGPAATNPRFMAAIRLSTGKGKGPKKNRFKSSSMILDAEVPARAILCSKP